MEKAGARGVGAKTCLNFRPRQPYAGRCGTPLMRCQERKSFCSPAPQLIAEFPLKVGHSICLSWLVRGRSGLAFVGHQDHQGSLQKDGTRQRACALHYLLRVLSGKIAEPSPATPFWLTSAGAAVLVFSLSIRVASRKTCCTRLLACPLGSATLVVPGTGLVRPSSLDVSGTPVPCPLCNVLVRVSSTAVNIPEARGLDWVSPS